MRQFVTKNGCAPRYRLVTFRRRGPLALAWKRVLEVECPLRARSRKSKHPNHQHKDTPTSATKTSMKSSHQMVKASERTTIPQADGSWVDCKRAKFGLRKGTLFGLPCEERLLQGLPACAGTQTVDPWRDLRLEGIYQKRTGETGGSRVQLKW
jgi:hypothetical protein